MRNIKMIVLQFLLSSKKRQWIFSILFISIIDRAIFLFYYDKIIWVKGKIEFYNLFLYYSLYFVEYLILSIPLFYLKTLLEKCLVGYKLGKFIVINLILVLYPYTLYWLCFEEGYGGHSLKGSYISIYISSPIFSVLIIFLDYYRKRILSTRRLGNNT